MHALLKLDWPPGDWDDISEHVSMLYVIVLNGLE